MLEKEACMSQISFRIAEHSRKPGVQILEILLDGNMVATMYPDEQNPGAVKLVSAHFAGKLTHFNQFPDGVQMDTGEGSTPPIPAIRISFDRREYYFAADTIVRES